MPHRKRSSPGGLRAAAQRAASRRRPGIPTARPEADRVRRGPRLTERWTVCRKTRENPSGEQLTSESVKAPRLCVCSSGSHTEASSILEARAPLQKKSAAILLQSSDDGLKCSVRGRDGALLLCREHVEFGCVRLRLPEHDGERLHDQSAQAEEKDEAWTAGTCCPSVLPGS